MPLRESICNTCRTFSREVGTMTAAILQRFQAELDPNIQKLSALLVDDSKCGSDFLNSFTRDHQDDVRKCLARVIQGKENLQSAFEALGGAAPGSALKVLQDADAVSLRGTVANSKWGALTLLKKMKESPQDQKILRDSLREVNRIMSTKVKKCLDGKLITDIDRALNGEDMMYSL